MQTEPATRPIRPVLPDFMGRPITLGEEPANWRHLGGKGGDILLLGLGPGKAASLPFARQALNAGHHVYWIEDEATLAALKGISGFALGPEKEYTSQWRQTHEIPEGDCQIYFYRPGMRLAPDFWGKILARLDLSKSIPRPSGSPCPVWLPGNETQLLHQELRQTLAECGCGPVYEATPGPSASELARVWPNGRPRLAISVNSRGLDPEGHIFHMLRELDIPVAIWLVDNPWHLVSAFKLPWWQKASLYVTDASFIPGLRKAGARDVTFLPLAAAPHMWRHPGSGAHGTPLFVGRSAFPGKEAFFGSARPDAAKWALALKMLQEGKRLPDYHWWSGGERLWPGGGRACGLGAEECSMLNRARWLEAGLPLGLRIVGDEGWRKTLPNAPLYPPVDYYGALPELYQEAEAVLNVTSLLLPGSLSQRHFDVWASGGLLLGDATGGLDIFPRDIREPVAMSEPGELGEKLAFFRGNPQAKRELVEAWRDELRARHLYRHRLETIFSHAGLALPDLAQSGAT